MFFLVSLFLRVIQPEHLHNISHNKLKIKSNEIGCDVTQDKIQFEHKLSVDEFIYCGPKNGANVGEFKVEKCLFQNIWGAKGKGNLIIGCENHDLFLNENKFTGCTSYGNIIHCFPKEDKNNNFYFKMYSNIFSDCHHPDANTKSVMILTHYKNNDIRNNSISYLNKENSQRAFEIDYYRDCKMIGNKITNSFHTDSSAIKFKEPGSGTNDLEIQNCVFTNCQGDNKSNGHKGGLAIIIEYLNSPLKIINTTFQKFKPDTVEESKDTAYFVRVETDQNTALPVTFSYCTFSYIENCAKSGGGIGFCYKNAAQKTLTFEYTKFEHLYNYDTSSSIGGGALSIDTSFEEIKKTDLIIIECSFYNISSTNNGGAIYFNSDNTKLTIESSNFTNTRTNNDQTFGGAIYIVRNENCNSEISIENCKFTNTLAAKSGHSIMIEKSFDDQISILSCDFIDCGENQCSYTVIFDVSKLNFQYNSFIFSDSLKNCGCIELKKITEHTIKANTFYNACINDDLIWNSAGIHYDSWNDLNSIVIEDNVFDSILGNNEGRCLFVTIIKEAFISINNNTIQNCPSGGPLVKVWFRSRRHSFKIDNFKLLNNTMNDYRDQTLGCTPHFWFENTFEQDSNHIDPIEITYENCNFQSNSNPTQGGALRFGANRYTANLKVNLHHCNFIENNAEYDGGAVHIQTYQGCKFDDCYFIKNKSNQGCGAIFIETEFKCINPSNSEETLPLPSEESRNPEIIINNCHFENNKGKDSHGIYIGECKNAPVHIFKCDFNDCGENGYVVSIQSKVQNIQFNNCSIVFSNGENSASGVLSVTDKIVFIGNTFDNCNKNTIQIEGLIAENNEIQFVDNSFINCNKGTIINVLNLFTQKPTFIGNTFKYVSLSSLILNIKLSNSIDSIDFINNTFCSFNAISNDIGGNGIELNHESSDNAIYISYVNCYFINNTNKQRGGSLHFDANQNNGNIHLTINECFFEQSKNEMNGGAIYINIKGDITIQKCNFNGNSAIKGSSIYIQPDFIDFTEQSNIKILESYFNKNGASECSSIFISPGSSKTLSIDSCIFEDETCDVIIDDFKNKIDINNNQFIRTSDNSALILTQKQDLKNEISIDFCIFDSCSGPLNKCFNIEISTYSFNFRNSIIKNLVGTGSDSYFGSILYKSKNTLSLQNISFINNSGNSLYGGGIAIKFFGISQLNMFKCNFTNNKAKQCTDVSRPVQESQKDYFNGDGGALQLGYICQMNDMNVLFSECNFMNNNAHRHGGALALQTYTIVRIEKCVFESNCANINEIESELLYNNHFDKKSKGRGGAIYINPSYSYDDKTGQCNTQNIHMTNVLIIDCDFIKNNANDGYAIYIEGENPGTEFIVTSNDFIDNYNENNYADDNNNIYGAVITTEICSLIENDIIEKNNFKYSNENILVKELSCVDHFGNTETQKFTQSNVFTNSNLFSSCYFSNSKDFTVSNEFSKSFAFSETNQFSKTHSFSESTKFTKSDQFVKTDAFTKSTQFTKSDQFAKTNSFSKSTAFSKSSIFTKSNDFSKSMIFSSSSTTYKILDPIITDFKDPSYSFSENEESNSLENGEIASKSITNNGEEKSYSIDGSSLNDNENDLSNSLTVNSESVSMNDDNIISSSTNNENDLSNSLTVSSESVSMNDDNIISSSTNNENDFTKSNTETINDIVSKTNLIYETPESAENKAGNKSNSLPLIIGIIVGIAVLIAIIIVIVIFVIRRKRNIGRVYENTSENEMMDSTNDFIQSYVSEDFENPLYNNFGLNNKDLFNEPVDESDEI